MQSIGDTTKTRSSKVIFEATKETNRTRSSTQEAVVRLLSMKYSL